MDHFDRILDVIFMGIFIQEGNSSRFPACRPTMYNFSCICLLVFICNVGKESRNTTLSSNPLMKSIDVETHNDS